MIILSGKQVDLSQLFVKFRVFAVAVNSIQIIKRKEIAKTVRALILTYFRVN